VLSDHRVGEIGTLAAPNPTADSRRSRRVGSVASGAFSSARTATRSTVQFTRPQPQWHSHRRPSSPNGTTGSKSTGKPLSWHLRGLRAMRCLDRPVRFRSAMDRPPDPCCPQYGVKGPPNTNEATERRGPDAKVSFADAACLLALSCRTARSARMVRCRLAFPGSFSRHRNSAGRRYGRRREPAGTLIEI